MKINENLSKINENQLENNENQDKSINKKKGNQWKSMKKQ